MANEQNLKPILDSQRARELQELSVQKRKENIAKRKTFKETLLAMLEEDKELQNNINLALLQKAKRGDIKAFEVVRDTIGEKPTEKIEAEVTNTNINITLEEEDQSDE